MNQSQPQPNQSFNTPQPVLQSTQPTKVVQQNPQQQYKHQKHVDKLAQLSQAGLGQERLGQIYNNLSKTMSTSEKYNFAVNSSQFLGSKKEDVDAQFLRKAYETDADEVGGARLANDEIKKQSTYRSFINDSIKQGVTPGSILEQVESKYDRDNMSFSDRLAKIGSEGLKTGRENTSFYAKRQTRLGEELEEMEASGADEIAIRNQKSKIAANPFVGILSQVGAITDLGMNTIIEGADYVLDETNFLKKTREDVAFHVSKAVGGAVEDSPAIQEFLNDKVLQDSLVLFDIPFKTSLFKGAVGQSRKVAGEALERSIGAQSSYLKAKIKHEILNGSDYVDKAKESLLSKRSIGEINTDGVTGNIGKRATNLKNKALRKSGIKSTAGMSDEQIFNTTAESIRDTLIRGSENSGSLSAGSYKAISKFYTDAKFKNSPDLIQEQMTKDIRNLLEEGKMKGYLDDIGAVMISKADNKGLFSLQKFAKPAGKIMDDTQEAYRASVDNLLPYAVAGAEYLKGGSKALGTPEEAFKQLFDRQLDSFLEGATKQEASTFMKGLQKANPQTYAELMDLTDANAIRKMFGDTPPMNSEKFKEMLSEFRNNLGDSIMYTLRNRSEQGANKIATIPKVSVDIADDLYEQYKSAYRAKLIFSKQGLVKSQNKMNKKLAALMELGIMGSVLSSGGAGVDGVMRMIWIKNDVAFTRDSLEKAFLNPKLSLAKKIKVMTDIVDSTKKHLDDPEVMALAKEMGLTAEQIKDRSDEVLKQADNILRENTFGNTTDTDLLRQAMRGDYQKQMNETLRQQELARTMDVTDIVGDANKTVGKTKETYEAMARENYGKMQDGFDNIDLEIDKVLKQLEEKNLILVKQGDGLTGSIGLVDKGELTFLKRQIEKIRKEVANGYEGRINTIDDLKKTMADIETKTPEIAEKLEDVDMPEELKDLLDEHGGTKPLTTFEDIKEPTVESDLPIID